MSPIKTDGYEPDDNDTPRLKTFTVPVAFQTEARDETDAAFRIVEVFANKRILKETSLDCWWLPNNPDVDGSDADQPRLHWSNECHQVGDAIAHHDCEETRNGRVLAEIAEILWPGRDPDAEWDSETIERVAEAMAAWRPAEDPPVVRLLRRALDSIPQGPAYLALRMDIVEQIDEIRSAE